MSNVAELETNPDFLEMRSYISRIATGPEMSKDLSREEAASGMRLILDGKVDPVQAGLFLIALRMKRETDEENLGILDALVATTETVTADVDHVLLMADPFNGYNRSLPASPFLPAVLASCGLPGVALGLETVAPKFGVTHHLVLKAAGANVTMRPQQAAAAVSDPACGWAYLDQASMNTALHQLVDLRTLMVKRSSLTTMEVMLPGIRGRRTTGLATGYVHKPYPRVYAMLAQAAGFDECILMRGVEGGVVPSLRQKATIFEYHDQQAEQPVDREPADIGITQDMRAVQVPAQYIDADERLDVQGAAAHAAELGSEALAGKHGPTYDALVYAATLCLAHHRRDGGLPTIADEVRAAIDSGKARNHFEANL